MSGKLNCRQRLGAVVAAALIAGALISVAEAAPSSAAETTPEPVAFGAYAKPRSGQSERQAVEALETQLGRKLEVVRVFETWDQTFPDSYHTWLKGSGHSIILSVKPNRSNGTRVSWPSIATAAPGSQVYNEIVSWAQRVKAYGVPVYVTFNHEPEAGANTAGGTNTDFIAAWRHWVDLFRAQGVTNAKFMWIMTDYSFFVSTSDRRYAPKWYPGDEWVDAMGTDAYNWHTCRPGTANAWKSLQQIIEPFRAFGALHPDKALWLSEFASVEDAANAGRKAAWLDAAKALFKQPGWQQFDGVLYFNATYSQSGQTVCYWYTDTSAASLASHRAMGIDPFYAGSAFGDDPPPPPPPPPPGDAEALLVVGTPTLSAGDTAARSRLEAAGYTVRVLDDSAVSATVTEDLVVISSSVSSALVAGTYRLTPVPVLVYKPWVYGSMALVSTFGSSSGSSVVISNSASPLAAGLSGTVPVTTTNGSIGWGTPVASADVIATASGRAVLFAYEQGDLLADGSTAASCRVVLPFSDKNLSTATAQGTALFDAAITWAGSC